MTQAMSHNPHDLNGKERGVMHKIFEALFIERHQCAVGFGDGAGTTRPRVDEGHLPDHTSGTGRFHDDITHQNIDLARLHDIHQRAGTTFAENGLALRKMFNLGLVLKDIDTGHGTLPPPQGEPLPFCKIGQTVTCFQGL